MSTIPGDVITTLISHYDGVDSNDAQDAQRRSVVLGYLQHINDYIHNYREWGWTYAYGTQAFTLPADNDVTGTPSNFMEWGRHGGVWRSSDKFRYHEEHMGTLMRVKVQNTGGTHHPIFATVGNILHFTYAPDANEDFDAFFRIVPQVLTDAPGDSSSALILPDQYVNTVLLPGTRFLMQQSKADAKDGEYGGQFKDGLQQMLVIENRKKTAADIMPLTRRNW